MTKITSNTPTVRQNMMNIDTNSSSSLPSGIPNISITPNPTGLNALAPGDSVAKNEQSDAKKLIDDGKPKGDGRAPEGDAALTKDFGNLRNIINAGGRPTLGTEASEDKSGGWMEEKKNINNEAASKSHTTLFEKRTTVKDYGHAKKTYSKKTGWTGKDSDNERDNISAHATLINTGFQSRAGFNLGKGEHTTDNGTTIKGRADVLSAHARGALSGGVDLANGKIEGEAAIRAGADLVSVEGSVSTENKLGKFSVKGKARVGVEANGNVGVRIGKDGARVNAGVEAFAGAKATMDVNQKVNIGGHKIGSVGLRGEAYAGIGAKAKVDAGFEKGHFTANVDVGVALGLGVGAKFNVDVDVKGTYNAIKDGASALKSKAAATWNRYKPW